MNNDIDSHWARIPGCTATCVWCASVLFDVPKRHVPQNVHRCYHGMRAARQRPGNARPIPHSTPGTRASPVPAPDAARAGHRCLAHLPSPARLVARSRPAAARANESSSWTDVFMAARQHWRSRRLTALRFAWYWEDHPLSSRLETPHEPPKRCGLTPANLGE